MEARRAIEKAAVSRAVVLKATARLMILIYSMSIFSFLIFMHHNKGLMQKTISARIS